MMNRNAAIQKIMPFVNPGLEEKKKKSRKKNTGIRTYEKTSKLIDHNGESTVVGKNVV